MKCSRLLWASCAFMMLTASAHAELKEWQQNFVGCSIPTSPYASQVLFQDSNAVRPLMKIAGLSAWSVPDENGKPQIALTTEDGLTIYGKIVGPQGEDISGALLATIPTTSSQDDPSGTKASLLVPNQTVNAAPASPELAQTELPKISTPAEPAAEKPISTEAETATAPQQVETASGEPSKMASIGSDNVPDIPVAKTVDELMVLARDTSMWVSMNKPKPDAPTVYVFFDPTCPYCALSIDHLQSRIRDNSIDLRIIMSPIKSAEAFDIAASIMHSENIGEAIIQQSMSLVGSSKPVPLLDAKDLDQRVLDGLRRNVMFMRANGAPGTPFYLYRTKEGAQFAFGQLTDAQLAAALPDAPPSPATSEKAGAASQ